MNQNDKFISGKCPNGPNNPNGTPNNGTGITDVYEPGNCNLQEYKSKVNAILNGPDQNSAKGGCQSAGGVYSQSISSTDDCQINVNVKCSIPLYKAFTTDTILTPLINNPYNKDNIRINLFESTYFYNQAGQLYNMQPSHVVPSKFKPEGRAGQAGPAGPAGPA